MPKKILIVDDEPDFLLLTESRLRSWGYDVATASNHQEAFDRVREGLPDLILLDVMMPGKDGYEVCHELKSQERMRAVPIILFTAQPVQKERVKKNYEFIAADDCIMKPFEPEELLRKIRQHIG